MCVGGGDGVEKLLFPLLTHQAEILVAGKKELGGAI